MVFSFFSWWLYSQDYLPLTHQFHQMISIKVLQQLISFFVMLCFSFQGLSDLQFDSIIHHNLKAHSLKVNYSVPKHSFYQIYYSKASFSFSDFQFLTILDSELATKLVVCIITQILSKFCSISLVFSFVYFKVQPSSNLNMHQD